MALKVQGGKGSPQTKAKAAAKKAAAKAPAPTEAAKPAGSILEKTRAHAAGETLKDVVGSVKDARVQKTAQDAVDTAGQIGLTGDEFLPLLQDAVSGSDVEQGSKVSAAKGMLDVALANLDGQKANDDQKPIILDAIEMAVGDPNGAKEIQGELAAGIKSNK